MDYFECAEELIKVYARALRCSVHQGTLDVSQGEGGLLMHLCLKHDGATAGELKDELGVGSGRIANALKNLEGKGYIIRSGSLEDKRLVLVNITEEGRMQVEERYQELLLNVMLLLQQLGEEDARAFIRLLKRITEISV